MKKRLLALAMLLGLVLSTIPAATATFAADADYDISNGHFYTQTNAGAGTNGFSITDDGGVPMWTWFKRYGGVDQLGYPNTGRFTLDGFTVQGTQRVVLQWRPDTQTMAFVNIFDKMHDLNLDPVLEATFQVPAQLDNSAAERGMTFDQVRAQRETWLNFPNVSIKNKYLDNPFRIDQFGLPTSTIKDYGPFVSIRLQRRAFQLWKNDGPGGIKAGTLTEVLGSDVAKTTNVFPKDATTPSAAPAGAAPGAPAAPAAGPATTSGLQYGFQAQAVTGQSGSSVSATRNAGFGWIKQQVQWKTLQGTQGGVINWGDLDSVADAAAANGVKVMFSVVSAPAWASLPGGEYPRNPSDFASFMRQMATKFKGRVQAYEIWNETNFAREVGPGNINPGLYVEMLKAVYPAIKAVDPNAIVVSGAPTPTGVNDPNVAKDDMAYLTEMYAYQGGVVKQNFDVLGAHNEPYWNPPEETAASPHVRTSYNNHRSFFFRGVEDYRNLMVQNGDGSKAIWETEIGYNSTATPPPGYEWTVSEQDQADLLVRLFKYAKANYPWMGVMFVWNLNFQVVVGPTDEKWGFGVMRAGYNARPAYTALQQMAK